MSETVRRMNRDESSPTGRSETADPSKSTERAAIQMCQAGDISGLEALYSLYSEKVFRTCYRILGDRAAAEDQTHEVFLHVFRKIDRFRGRSTFSTWLYRLTVNQTLNRLRSRKRRLLKMLGMEFVEGMAGKGPAPDREVLRNEQSDVVQQMLSSLSAEHRTVLVLREIEELSYREISSILEIPRGTVMSRLYRARRELKSAFLSGNSEDPTSVQKGAGR